jgi:hypothetical protein
MRKLSCGFCAKQEATMEEQLLISGKDTLLIAIPFAFILMFSILRLDQIVAAPKGALRGRRLACGLDERGEPVLRDPDGRLSGPPRGKRKHSLRKGTRLPAACNSIPGGAKARFAVPIGWATLKSKSASALLPEQANWCNLWGRSFPPGYATGRRESQPASIYPIYYHIFSKAIASRPALRLTLKKTRKNS